MLYSIKIKIIDNYTTGVVLLTSVVTQTFINKNKGGGHPHMQGGTVALILKLYATLIRKLRPGARKNLL